MAERVDCVVLDVGQGSGNFYEVYDASDALTATALLDLGSEAEEEAAGGPAVLYVIAQLKAMPGGAHLNVVMLSHSDSDHINLVSDVLDAFSPDGVGKPQLVVSWVVFAGERSKYAKRSSRNVIDYLTDFVPNDGTKRVYSLGSNQTNFTADPSTWGAFFAGPLALRVLISNSVASDARVGETSTAPSRKNTGGYAINTNSIVVVADYNTSPTVTTGDATGITMAAANQVIDRFDLGTDMFIDTFMVTAPHHGARATTFNLLGIKTPDVGTDELSRVNLQNFVNNLMAKSLSVSAERVGRYKHPSMEVLQYFWPRLGRGVYTDPLLTTSEAHWTTAYYTDGQYLLGTGGTWPSPAGWYTTQTDYNVFTNLYFVASLVGGVLVPGPPSPPGMLPSPPVAVPIAVPPSPIGYGEDVDTTGITAPPLGAIWIFRVPRALGVKRSVLRATNRALVLAAEQAAKRRVDQIRRWMAEQPARFVPVRGAGGAGGAGGAARSSRPAEPSQAGRLRGLKVVR